MRAQNIRKCQSCRKLRPKRGFRAPIMIRKDWQWSGHVYQNTVLTVLWWVLLRVDNSIGIHTSLDLGKRSKKFAKNFTYISIKYAWKPYFLLSKVLSKNRVSRMDFRKNDFEIFCFWSNFFEIRFQIAISQKFRVKNIFLKS